MINILKEELPREKLIEKGPHSLTDVELLAILLRTGTKEKNVLELSREILNTFNTEEISRKSYEELLEFKGINKAKACQIVSIFELSRRLNQKKEKVQIKNSKDIYNHIKLEFSNLPVEKVMAIYVNSKNYIIKKEFLFEGGFDYSIIDPKIIMKKALIYNANGFFIIHNHPSGDTTPSNEDIAITNTLKEISKTMEIRFLDHLIIGNYYYSFFEDDKL